MDGMLPLAMLHELFDYHYWARDRQLQACAALDPEQFLRPIGGSFPSLRDTLAHLVAVEWLWLQRWRGENPRTLIPVDEFPTLAAISQRWAAIEGEMRAWLAALDEPALQRPLTCFSTRGEPWTYPLWRMIAHLLNHQSYHRGQVTTLLRILGTQPPRVDFLVGLDAGFRP
jgi:uncharacterized damage-inducible protein DinB